MENDAPFIPEGMDIDTDYFPKASENDEDLKIILNDKIQVQKNVEEFKDFNDVCYPTLQNINQKAAIKALKNVKKKKKVPVRRV